MNNKIRAVLLTVLTFGLTFGLVYGVLHYAHIIGMIFFAGMFILATYLLYTMYKGMLDHRDKYKQ